MLAAEGLGCRIVPSDEGWQVVVPPGGAGAAAAALEAFASENPVRPPATDPPPAADGRWAGIGAAAALVLAYGLTGSGAAAGPRFVAGASDARAVLGGEVWRTVTALTLHSDASHLVSNALAGAVLVAGAGRVLGGGLALLLTVLSGALGNAANAALRGPSHVAVGASTAVLGAVGVLAGSAALRTARDRRAPGRAWVPVAAGLALLAMLGTGERTDLGAHLCGFVAGSVLGALAARVWPSPPVARTQRWLGVSAAAVVAAAWAAALCG